ncbi:dolichyl-phosphate-mannose--protein mannosyltransferase 2 [Trichomonascus vanleenenianus]|uniref:dolichyl-phosphate-mannose-protein mannosyltransferase PMT2 n=1 Tax=Trichomonascus vanleenenianus TaxID=2268995 RepID=UPI003EC9CCCB
MASATASGVKREGDELRQRGGPRGAAPMPSYMTQSEEDDKKKGAPDGSLINDLSKLESWAAPLLFTALALFTRLYQIGKSKNVTWDEAHFGKFGSHYLKREYYFDVHPPLGKMLVGLSGYIAGYNGSFGFESGTPYPEYLDFTTMRVFNAMFNVLCVPVAYFTAKNLGLSRPAVWLVSLMILLEHSYITLGKFILLDSMLALFTFTTMLGLTAFHKQQRNSFSPRWWATLLLTGLSIGCVCSVKMVGLFVTAVVGVYTVADLWIKFGDTKMPFKRYFAHWLARIVGFIIVPALVFMASFKMHFIILNHTGPGDANMSSLFQANLIGNSIEGGPVDIAYGSKITLKNQGLNGGLLHSHVQVFPEGSEQQQVTTYHHKDLNNEWIIEHRRPDDYYSPEEELGYIADGDVIRFYHPSTGRNLHSHQIPAPLTKKKYEVSCYGNMTLGDEKDNWIVEIVENLSKENKSRVHPLSTSIRLRHQAMGCYLSGEGNNLPPWGFRQGEVTCDPSPMRRDKRTWWNVENHWNDRMDSAANRTLPKSHFLRDFVQLNFAMMASNNALVPDPDKQDDLASQAWEWPILHVGLRLCGWGSDNVRYFLLGHPTTTWMSTAGLGLFGIMTLLYICRWQRQYVDFNNREIEHYAIAGIIPALGWFFHYLPFVVMGRVKYVHHYLPALYFAILVFAFLVDHATKRWANKWVSGLVYLGLYALTIGIFILFAPISFGMTGDPADYSYLNWFSTWRIS